MGKEYKKGDKIKIAVIDDDVNLNHVKDESKIISCKKINIDNKKDRFFINIVPKRDNHISHSSLVISTFQKYSDMWLCDYEIIEYNIFDDNDYSDGISMIRAICDCIDKSIDIIIMSLTCPVRYKNRLKILGKRLVSNNIFIFCSASNKGDISIPAELRYFYGVKGLRYNNGGYLYYKPDRKVQFEADINPEFVGKKENPRVFSGTSKATAIVAAYIAHYIYNIGLYETQKVMQHTIYKVYDKKNKDISLSYIMKQSRTKILITEFKKYYPDFDETSEIDLNRPIGWNQRNYDILVKIIKKLDLKCDLIKCASSDIYSFYCLLQFLLRL